MKKISWWRTSFGLNEIKRITEAISSECISQGPITAEFEHRISKALGVPYVVTTTSGSMAILISLIAAGVKAGDEVIVPNRTWIATAHAPLLLGAKVVLVDVEADRPILDVNQIEKKITKRTKAIIPVHLNGRAVDMEAVNRIASKYKLKVIEDAAQAFCSQNAAGFLGAQSLAGCFSLSVAKIISTGQGGFVITRNKKTYERLKLMRTHGVRDVINASYTQMGFNFRFTDIQASMGLAQLDSLAKRIEKVKEVYAKYETSMSEFNFLKFLPVDINKGEIPIYIEVLCRERSRLVNFLAKRGIQTRSFYPDLNTAPYLKSKGKFPHSKVFAEQGLFLPCGPAQPLENINRVLDALRKFKNYL